MDFVFLANTLNELGQPKYRFSQIWSWLSEGCSSFAEMTNLPLELRAALEERIPFSTLEVEHQAVASDGTVKTLFKTAKGRPVEAVLMRYRDGRRSVCLSSQSGCPLTCTFCATGQMQFGGNLSASEILDQALHFRRIEPIDHVVFMGMGEPTMNLDAVLEACRLLPDIGVTERRIAISTVGWLPGIEKLSLSDAKVRLALSLHAPNDALRSEIMPVNDRYPISAILTACQEYHRRKKHKIFVEYVMLAGVNDRYEQAVELAEILDPKIFKVNLIPYNPTDSRYDGSGRTAIDAFKAVLERKRLPATVRLTRGRDIDAACGQLAVSRS